MIENKTVEAKKVSLSQQIILKDRYNGEIYSLEKISGGRSVFMEISASWCSACKEMDPITSKLYEMFKGKAFFIRVMLSSDNEQADKTEFPVMEMGPSLDNTEIKNSPILPRVIILDSSGELVADISGQYPLLYYYGIISEL